jgi:hypothetical protein
MKRLFALFLFVAASPTLNAQVLSLGARLGPTAYLEESFSETLHPFDYQQGAITPELFARYQRKNRWAFEASLVAPTRLYYEERVSAVGAGWQHGLQVTHTHYYELGLTAQYELSCPHAKKGAKPLRLHYYMGASAVLALVHDRSEVYSDTNPEASVMTIVNNDFQVWGGLNHMLAYDISRNWTLTAIGDFRVNLDYLVSFRHSYIADYPDASIGFRVGAAYRISKNKKK